MKRNGANLTEGKPVKLILQFAIPVFLGNLFQLFYGLIDTKIVGSTLGEGALAAVGSVSILYNLLTGFFNGLTLGFSVVTARYFGAGDTEKLKKSVAGTILLGFVTAAILVTGVFVFLRPLLSIMHVPAEQKEMAYNYLDDDGKPVGIDVELAEAVCEQLGYTPVFQYIVWDKKDEYLDNGKVDCLWGSFTMNGREDEYQWAGPYLYSRQVIAVRTDSKIRNISDLAGKRVAVQATTKPEEVLLERSDPRVPEVDMVYSLSGMDEIYASLRKGYVDAITGHESALERFVGNAPDMYAILDESLYISELGVAFKNDTHQDLAKKMTQILKEMQDDGTLRDMVEKYGLDAEKALGVTNAE